MKHYMNDIYAILKDIKPDVDYVHEEKLIDDGILDSFDIVMIVGAIEDEFSIRISPMDITADNFNSAKAIYDMIRRIMSE